jgi:hypothetical protein
LRLRRPNAFELIREYNMYEAVRDKAVLLMEFDQYLLEEQDKAEPDESTPKKPPTEMPAVQLLIENTQAIPVSSEQIFDTVEICADCLACASPRKWYNSSSPDQNSYTRIWMRYLNVTLI